MNCIGEKPANKMKTKSNWDWEDIFWLLIFLGTIACGILAFRDILR